MPRLIRPMMASLRRELPHDDDRYGWEFKWDGVRAIGYVAAGRVRLLSRTGNDITGKYPELAVLAGRVPGPVIVDGEIIALSGGRPDLGLLQSRMHARRPPGRLVQAVPVQLYLFDLLYQDDESLLEVPYAQRRTRLEDLGLDHDPIRTPPWHRGGARDIQAVSLAHGLEGIVGKPLASAYHPGQRRDWIKVKNIRHQEVIICGWTPGHGRRADTIGSLLLGVYDRGRLRYAGHVGTGFTQAMLADLTRQLRPLQTGTSPFGTPVPGPHARDTHWVQPRLVGEVTFAEWTRDRIMRHPSWHALHPGKTPARRAWKARLNDPLPGITSEAPYGTALVLHGGRQHAE